MKRFRIPVRGLKRAQLEAVDRQISRYAAGSFRDETTITMIVQATNVDYVRDAFAAHGIGFETANPTQADLTRSMYRTKENE